MRGSSISDKETVVLRAVYELTEHKEECTVKEIIEHINRLGHEGFNSDYVYKAISRLQRAFLVNRREQKKPHSIFFSLATDRSAYKKIFSTR